MPKQDHSRDLLPHLDSKISAIRQQCYQLRAEREFMQVRVYELVRDVDALVRHFARSHEKPREGSEASSSPAPASARRSSASLQSLDCLREGGTRGQGLSRSSLSIDDAILRLGIKETGPPSCPPPTRSLQSSPTARDHRKRVTPLDEAQRGRSTSYLKQDSARSRSNSQQSLPDSISRDAPAHKQFMVRTRSGDVRTDAKMSLSSSSPTLACKESPGHALLFGQKEGDKKETHVNLLVSKTCTDL